MKIHPTDKKAFNAVLINFAIGGAIGTALYFAQGKITPVSMQVTFEKSVSFAQVAYTALTNLMWIGAMVLSVCIAPMRVFYPIVILRGIISAYASAYIVSNYSVVCIVAAAAGQCLSFLPLMIFMCVKIQKTVAENNSRFITLYRRKVLAAVILCTAAALAESLVFKLFCAFL